MTFFVIHRWILLRDTYSTPYENCWVVLSCESLGRHTGGTAARTYVRTYCARQTCCLLYYVCTAVIQMDPEPDQTTHPVRARWKFCESPQDLSRVNWNLEFSWKKSAALRWHLGLRHSPFPHSPFSIRACLGRGHSLRINYRIALLESTTTYQVREGSGEAIRVSKAEAERQSEKTIAKTVPCCTHVVYLISRRQYLWTADDAALSLSS